MHRSDDRGDPYRGDVNEVPAVDMAYAVTPSLPDLIPSNSGGPCPTGEGTTCPRCDELRQAVLTLLKIVTRRADLLSVPPEQVRRLFELLPFEQQIDLLVGLHERRARP